MRQFDCNVTQNKWERREFQSYSDFSYRSILILRQNIIYSVSMSLYCHECFVHVSSISFFNPLHVELYFIPTLSIVLFQIYLDQENKLTIYTNFGSVTYLNLKFNTCLNFKMKLQVSLFVVAGLHSLQLNPFTILTSYTILLEVANFASQALSHNPDTQKTLSYTNSFEQSP